MKINLDFLQSNSAVPVEILEVSRGKWTAIDCDSRKSILIRPYWKKLGIEVLVFTSSNVEDRAYLGYIGVFGSKKVLITNKGVQNTIYAIRNKVSEIRRNYLIAKEQKDKKFFGRE